MGSKEDSLGERAFRAAYAETGNNGSMIDWRYWVHQLPRLTIAESARLMCGLDPDKFKNLENKRNNKDQSLLFRKVEKIQRLAELEGKEIATPSEWLAWAKERQFAIHDGFKLAVEVSPAPEAAVSDDPAKPAATVDRGWVMKKAALIEKHEREWSSINRDFQDASENGLSKAAKAPGHGDWFEADALNWADQRGKRTNRKQHVPANSIFNLAGTKHTTED